ncbi:hypothetical protein F5148DRAFT_1377375 [Russula earlei]|uniref:Uncharacterized protein n=1 Tax=Russula earlei TaxID=71964 RepID=A0ACC0U5F2_9AGAM|nr:hypothetical protein F5148DRAFT_1377375 [Russula earlei]
MITLPQTLRSILTDELSPVSRASVTMLEVTNLHMVLFGDSVITGFVQSLLASTTRSSTTIRVPSQLEAPLEGSSCEHRRDRVTINTLPDDVLVEIFHFYVNLWRIGTNGWHTLVHVCQRWRHVVFASPRRLNLRLEYGGKRPMSEMLEVWPALPVEISYGSDLAVSNSWENVALALESEHRHRICQINLLDIPPSKWERFAAAMQKPLPELSHLVFSAEKNTVTSLSDSFLGGSAPLLRELRLEDCPFPGIITLLLSASQLVVLDLWFIPDSGYISPQDLVTALSVLSRLEILHLGFESPLSPASRPPPPLTRSVLAALTRLEFQGVHEYLEDLLAQIEAPLLNKLHVTFFMDIDFVLPQLLRLITHAESFNSCHRAAVRTSDSKIRFKIFRESPLFPDLSLEISCREFDRQLASLAQVCSSSFPLLSALVQLDITGYAPQSRWEDDMETTEWLEFLAPFTAMKDLRLSDEVAPHVCQALERLAEERVAEVLPALQNIFLRDPDLEPKYIGGFVCARNLSGHPVEVYRWKYYS